MVMPEWDHSKFLFPWLCFFSLKFELFLSHKSSTILALCCYLFKTLILDHGVKEIHTKHQKTLFLVWSQPVANYSSIFSAEDITILLTEDRRGRPDGLTQIHQSLVKDSSILIKAISSCLISQGQWTTYALPIKHTHTHTLVSVWPIPKHSFPSCPRRSTTLKSVPCPSHSSLGNYQDQSKCLPSLQKCSW